MHLVVGLLLGVLWFRVLLIGCLLLLVDGGGLFLLVLLKLVLLLRLSLVDIYILDLRWGCFGVVASGWRSGDLSSLLVVQIMLVHLFWGQIFLLLLGHEVVWAGDVHWCVLLATFRYMALLASMFSLLFLLFL